MQREFIVKTTIDFKLCEEAIDNVHQVLNVSATHDYSERFKAYKLKQKKKRRRKKRSKTFSVDLYLKIIQIGIIIAKFVSLRWSFLFEK